MTDLTPRQIMQALDRHIVGQEDAKKAVAIAIRNRWRRLQLPREIRGDIPPKNILMIGPTGVGKTEIARRLAQLVRAPFVKVEATKYTEVGYHGRDVDSMIRDLMERSVAMVREEFAKSVREQARLAAEDRILDQMLPTVDSLATDPEQAERRGRTREKLRAQLNAGGLSEHTVEVVAEERSVPPHVMAAMGLDQMPDIEQMMERLMPSKTRRRRFPVPEALEIMTQQEIDRLVDPDKIQHEAVQRCEESGIVFIDELDKICGTFYSEGGGPDVSRSGVQRDLLPIVEGSSVSTRYGLVRTDHILFIAAGAFTQSRPSDLMPELQGRFPIRVELEPLTSEDFVRILTEPQNALIRQQVELMRTEGVSLTFTPDSINELAEMAWKANETLENIGARRLYTVVEKVMEDIAFYASEASNKEVTIDADYVRMRLSEIVNDEARREYEL